MIGALPYRGTQICCVTAYIIGKTSANIKAPKDVICSYSQIVRLNARTCKLPKQNRGRVCHGSTSVLLVKKWELESLPLLGQAVEVCRCDSSAAFNFVQELGSQSPSLHGRNARIRILRTPAGLGPCYGGVCEHAAEKQLEAADRCCSFSNQPCDMCAAACMISTK